MGFQRVAAVGGGIDLAAGGAEIHAARFERVHGHRVAQHVDVAVLLRQALGERFPFVAARPAAIDAQLAIGREMLGVALDRDDVDGVRLVRVNLDREPEVGRQVAADLVPGVAGVVAAHDVPMLLHEQHVRARGVHGDAVDAVADLRVRVGQFVVGLQAAVDRPPGLAGVVGAEHARGRDGDEDALGVARVEQDRVQAHAAGAGLPEVALGAAQPGKLLPGLAAVRGAEQRGVFHAGIDGVRVGRATVQDARRV